MRPVYLLFAVFMLTAMCLSQEQASSQAATQKPDQKAQATETAGQKTVVGCIAMGAPTGFVLKGEDGVTYPLRTDRDLSAYVGKKVQIQASWTKTGVSLIEGESTAVPSGQPGAKAAPPSTGFAGDVHLRYKGKVIGDCLKEKK